jgi:hypothetical protein
MSYTAKDTHQTEISEVAKRVLKHPDVVDLTSESPKATKYYFNPSTKFLLISELNYKGYDVVYGHTGPELLEESKYVLLKKKKVVKKAEYKLRLNVLQVTDSYGTYEVDPSVKLVNVKKNDLVISYRDTYEKFVVDVYVQYSPEDYRM